MTRKTVLIRLVAATVFAFSVAPSLAGGDMGGGGGDRSDGGGVVPCSLAGVNPAHHPEIFGNPAAAQSYGFVQGPDRVWRVDGNCIAGRSGSPMAAAPASSVGRKRR